MRRLWVIRVEPTLNALVIGRSGFPEAVAAVMATRMRRAATLLFVLVAVLAVVPGWSGEERLALLSPGGTMTAVPVPLDAADPSRSGLGALTYLGGVQLRSSDPAFGGFSALSVAGDRFTLLSDGGNVVRFRMGGDWVPREVAFANLPSGPRTGWEKRDRDSESLAVDPAGRVWIGFENGNSIWRYAPGLARAEAEAAPAAMRDWDVNGGSESLARLPDGRFVAISETSHVPPRFWRGRGRDRLGTRDALIFAGDPVEAGPVRRFAYVPSGRYDPVDAAALPNGDLLVLDRDFRLPFHWSNRLSLVREADVRAGAVTRGRLLAVLDAPVLHDNFEGFAVTQEGGDTILWLVSDDNQTWPQRSLLLKFRVGL